MTRLDGLDIPELVEFYRTHGFSPAWRKAVLRTGKTASEQDLLRLAELLRTTDRTSRQNVATVMAEIENDHAVKVLLEKALEAEDDETVRVAIGMLMHMREAAVDLVRDIMQSNEGIIRLRAALILAETGNAQGTDILIDALRTADTFGDEDVLPRIMEAIGQLRDPRGILPLIRIFVGQNRLLRLVAEKALISIGEPAVAALLDLAGGSDDLDFRCRAVEALGQIGSSKAVPALIALMNRSEGFLQHQIIEALGRIGDQRSTEALLAALAGGEPATRVRASAALVKIGGPAVTGLSGLLLDHPNPDVRRNAAQALGQIDDTESVPVLIAALEDEDSLVQRTAAEALGKLRDSRALVPLSQALRNDNWFVVQGAADALVEIGDAQAIDPLLHALRDDRIEVRRWILRALETFGPVVEILSSSLKQPDRRLRFGVVQALAEVGSAEAAEALIRALRDSDPEMRRYIARKLVSMGSGSVQSRLDRITQNNEPGADELRDELRRKRENRK